MKPGTISTILLVITGIVLLNSQCYAKEQNTVETKIDKTVQQTKNNTRVDNELKKNSSVDASDYLKMVVGLFFIVGFIFTIAWLIKRMGTLNPNHNQNLKVIAGLTVGQREKIIVLQVMDEQLLVGVTQSNIQLLSKLETPLEQPKNTSMSGFQKKLQSALNGYKNSKHGGDNS